MMIRLLIAAVLTWLTTFVAAEAWIAQGGSAPPPPSFTSAGDCTGCGGGFTHWWGASFAYSAATRNTKAVNLCNGGVCADVNSDATTGIVVNAPTINGAPCNTSTHICTISKTYDKAGTADMAPSDPAHPPIWVPDGCGTGIPGASFVAASHGPMVATISAIAQPFVTEAVHKMTGAAGSQQAVFGDASGSVWHYHESGANTLDLYATGATTVGVSLTDNTFGASGGVFNGASSYLRANSATQSGTLSSGGFGTSACIGGNNAATCFAQYFDGMICEAGVISGATSSATVDNLVTNARSSVRFNF